MIEITDDSSEMGNKISENEVNYIISSSPPTIETYKIYDYLGMKYNNYL
jgi:hypothetical protein